LSHPYPTHIPPITHIIKEVGYRWDMGRARKGQGMDKNKEIIKTYH